MAPLLITVLKALPPNPTDWLVFDPATTVPLATPLLFTACTVPDISIVPTAIPPDEIVCDPPLRTIVPLARPPDRSLWVPLSMIAPLSVPARISVAPPTLVFIAEPPASTFRVPPLFGS